MDNHTEILINHYLAGTASDEQIRALDQVLREDESARRAILKASWMDAALFRVCGKPSQNATMPLPAETTQAIEEIKEEQHRWARSIRRSKRRLWYTQPARLAAIFLGALLVGAMAFGTYYATLPPHVATIAINENAVVTGGSASSVGDRLRAGERLDLRKGRLTVRFNQGALVDLQGPATLEITNPNGGYLMSGRLLATVPPRAKGFTIKTDQLLARDFGTVFGVDAKSDGQVEVHVFSGEVEAELVDGSNTSSANKTTAGYRLVRNQALRVPEKGLAQRMPASSFKFGEALRWHSGGLRSLTLHSTMGKRRPYTIRFDSASVRRMSPARYRQSDPTQAKVFNTASDVDFSADHYWLLVEDLVDAQGQPTGDMDFEDVQIEVRREPRDGYDVVTLRLFRGTTSVDSRLVDADGNDLLNGPISRAPDAAIYRFKVPTRP